MQVTDRVDSVRVAPNTRLTFLGRLAQRIGEHPDAHDLSMFVYTQLRDTLPVDSFYVARAGLQSEGLYGVLVEDEGVEYPPASVYIAPYDESIAAGPLLFDRETNLRRWTFGTGRAASSALTCSMRAGGRLVGQIAVLSYDADAYSADDAQFLQVVADQMAMPFDRMLANEEAAQREIELRALLESSRMVNTSLDLGAVLSGLAASLVQAVFVDAAVVSRLESDEALLVPCAHVAAPDLLPRISLDPFSLKAHKPLAAVIGEQQPFEETNEARWPASEGWTARLALPLTVEGVVIGLVELASRKPERRFSARDIEICQAIIRQAAVGIQHAQVYQRAIERSTSLSGLAALSEAINNAPDDLNAVLQLVCEEAIAQLRVSRASLFLLDLPEQQLHLKVRSGATGPLEVSARIAVDEPYSYAARSVRERRTIVDIDLSRAGMLPIVDVGNGRSAVAVPLRHHGVTLGALLLVDRKRRNTFHTDELRLVGSLAGQAAAAVARSRVRAAEKERIQIASVLGTISASISADDEPATIYRLILDQSASLIPFDEASISLFEDDQEQVGAAIGPTLQALYAGTTTASIWRDRHNVDRTACLRVPSLAAALEAAGIHDLLSLPLLIDGSVMGRITFASRRTGQYDTHQAQLAALLAERTSQVVRMVRLRAAEQSALAKLTELDALRRDFVATVSHELRTPLTGILGYLELLINRWASIEDERRQNMLERTQSAAARLEHLVNDLLLFSNVEHQGLKLQIGRYPLSALVDQAVEEISTKYRGQVIEIIPGRQNIFVRADAQRAIQVIANLLDNAVKYSSVGEPVHVRWRVRQGKAQISVRDHGPGIAAEDIPRLFHRFGTLNHTPRPGQVGTGIGLYICKWLVEAMSGEIWVTSRQGRGSIFHFTLPRAQE